MEYLGKLPGSLEQRAGPVAGEIGVQKCDPLLAFVEAVLLKVAKAGLALVEFVLSDVQGFLGELEVESRHFAR